MSSNKPECKTYPLKVLGVIKSHLQDQQAFNAAFEKNIEVTVSGDLHSYDCKKGLFAISGGDEQMVKGQALNYFTQYYIDGEYDESN